jgi:hypothetical protein
MGERNTVASGERPVVGLAALWSDRGQGSCRSAY